MKIVLAHGFPGFVNVGGIEYFNHIAEFLRSDLKVDVLTPGLSPLGTTKERAQQLGEDVAAFAATERVHVIAHSGGGLDARFLVSPDGFNRSDLIATITTISTPHKGTPIADVALGLVQEFNHFTHLIRLMIALRDDGLSNLTTGYMRDHPYADSSNVKYFSYAGVGGKDEQGILSSVLFLPHQIVFRREGRNDGFVSVESAKHGKFKGELAADHAEEIGHDLSGTLAIRRLLGEKVFEPFQFFKEIVTDLARE